MRIFTDGAALPNELRGAAAGLGNFDGVHRGHAAVIAAARAAMPAAPSAVVTFDPHPRRHFAPDAPGFLLTPLSVKARRLAALGVQALIALPFDAAMAALTPEAFARDILATQLGLAHVQVGADFCFGAGRAGNVETLRTLGRAYGFGVGALALTDDGGAAFSSSGARQALREGRPRDAAAILGAPHVIEGVVERGDQRGRTIGFPTANIALGDVLAPRYGVYAVRATLLDAPDASAIAGVANIGIRPTFNKTTPNLEAHLFDFNQDIYGRRLAVELIEFLRPEQKFSGLDALIAQINADAAAARKLLAAAAS